ncbi:nucleoside 2-deoxyribosyltransferase [Candidatus Parcubacteria bacterium]|nr:nucleoside 2-deoxyribosyltransferase [Patescibacteria group bacterium]MCG2689542.1 nucleoside 2-deoxyribosyltransferase [Candidatus Parcubacteria bacterium]
MKTVVICGSRRFKKEIREFESKLIKAGVVVFSPYLHEGKDEWDKLSLQYKKFVALGLTHDHFYKIRMADVVFVYNKDGYAGVSTTLELGYAVALGKPIYALSDKDEELCRLTLFREVIKTPRELINKLK